MKMGFSVINISFSITMEINIYLMFSVDSGCRLRLNLNTYENLRHVLGASMFTAYT